MDFMERSKRKKEDKMIISSRETIHIIIKYVFNNIFLSYRYVVFYKKDGFNLRNLICFSIRLLNNFSLFSIIFETAISLHRRVLCLI